MRTLDGSLGVAIISLLGEGADHEPDPEGTFLLGAQGDILIGLQHSSNRRQLQRQLPNITLANRPLRDISDQAVQAPLAANNPPKLYQRAGQVGRVRVISDGATFQPFSPAHMRGALTRAANFVQHDGGSHVDPPLPLIQDLLTRDDLQLPPLRGVVEAPVMRPDGSVLEQPGYDPATGLYLHTSPSLIVPPLPQSPTKKDADLASYILYELLGDFPFEGEASFPKCTATILTYFVRHAIGGPVPMAVNDKTQRGSGGSLLTDVAAMMPPDGQARC